MFLNNSTFFTPRENYDFNVWTVGFFWENKFQDYHLKVNKILKADHVMISGHLTFVINKVKEELYTIYKYFLKNVLKLVYNNNKKVDSARKVFTEWRFFGKIILKPLDMLHRFCYENSWKNNATNFKT